MNSRLRFLALVLVMAGVGLSIALIAHRVDTLSVQLEDSKADRASLAADLNDQEAASAALAEQVKRLGGKPVVEPPMAEALPGPAGPRGPAGPAGPRGPAGKNGAAGTAGSDGRTGAAGADGIDGEPGAPGPQGPPGPAGADGANGADGADGSDGADGRSVESVTCDRGIGTFVFTYSDGTTQTVQCTPTAAE